MKSVCYRCIQDASLGSFIKANADQAHCDYCGKQWKKPQAMELHDVLHHMRKRIAYEYEDAANSVGYDSGEGGYQLPTIDSYELLDELGIGWDLDNEELTHDLALGLGDTPWVHVHPYSLEEGKARLMGWEQFARVVKHRVRYLMFPAKKPEEFIVSEEVTEPSEMLEELGELFREYELFSVISAGTVLHRVRIHAPEQGPENTIEALGPPPAEAARFANRMSPAGISMFYAAFDEETAVAETKVRHDGKPAERTIAKFKVTEDIVVLDLTTLPDYPGLFDVDESRLSERPAIGFLYDFVDDFTKPIEKDGREHVDYVPSQVVTEFVRYRLPEMIGKKLAGIRYRSARRENGDGCVLFYAREDFEEPESDDDVPPIELLDAETRVETIDTASH